MVTALIVITVLVVLFFLVVYGGFSLAFKPFRQKVDDYRKIPNDPQMHQYKEKIFELCDELAALPYEEVSITSFDGYRLMGKYYEVKTDAPIIIQCHGYHGSPIRDFCSSNRIARESGYNTLIIEERAMHRSEGRAITFGINERQDVKNWCEYLSDRFGNVPIILMGVSMGAATVLMASELELPSNVKGVIADCPYSSPIKILMKVGAEKKMPHLLMRPLTNLSSRIFGRFDIEAATPIDAVQHTKLPIMIVHGLADDFVPCQMSRDMKEANPKIRLELFPDAHHVMCSILDSERYSKIFNEFLTDIL